MPAAGALIDVTAEGGGTAADDGGQDLQVQPGEPFPAARIRSATSSGGRDIYGERSERASSGLAVAPIWRFDR